MSACAQLYTVTKEKTTDTILFVTFSYSMDFLQLFLLVVNPLYGWDIVDNGCVRVPVYTPTHSPGMQTGQAAQAKLRSTYMQTLEDTDAQQS